MIVEYDQSDQIWSNFIAHKESDLSPSHRRKSKQIVLGQKRFRIDLIKGHREKELARIMLFADRCGDCYCNTTRVKKRCQPHQHYTRSYLYNVTNLSETGRHKADRPAFLFITSAAYTHSLGAHWRAQRFHYSGQE